MVSPPWNFAFYFASTLQKTQILVAMYFVHYTAHHLLCTTMTISQYTLIKPHEFVSSRWFWGTCHLLHVSIWTHFGHKWSNFESHLCVEQCMRHFGVFDKM